MKLFHIGPWERYAHDSRSTAKLLKVMRLTAVLLTIFSLHVAGHTTAQINYQGKEVAIQKVLEVVKLQGGIYMAYNEVDLKLELAKPVTVSFKNSSVKEALDEIFKDQPLTYSIVNKTVFVIKKAPVVLAQSHMSSLPITVRGKVVNQDGEPVAGVTVQVKGTNKVTATNSEGEFELVKVEADATIVLTAVNITKLEETVNGRSSLILRVSGRTGILDQVQVIAYGTSSQRISTGTVATVKGSDIEKQPVNNPLLGLSGRVPGVLITQSKGLPGSGVTVRIQGQNSIGNGNDPLYVIDGVPYVSQMLSTTTGGPAKMLGSSGGPYQGNPLSYINMSDIESISILKDAEATAIYGSRAANGAILINTKKAKQGPMQFEINFQTGVSQIPNYVRMLNTSEYVEMRKEALQNDGLVADSNADFDLTLWDTTRYTNWQKELVGRSANFTTANAKISGGNSQTQYLVGMNFSNESTIYPGDFSDRKGGAFFNINANSSNQRVSIQMSGQYMVDNNRLPVNDLMLYATALAPNAPRLYNKDGSLNWETNSSGVATWDNPLALLMTQYNNKTRNILTSFSFNLKIAEGLNFKTNLGYNNLTTDEVSATPLMSYRPEDRANGTRSATYSKSSIESFNIEPQLSYTKNFLNSNLAVLAGATVNQRKSEGYVITGLGYNSDAVLTDMNSAATISKSGSTDIQYKYTGIFSRISYRMSEKYLFNFTGRRDGSSNFGSENKFKNFWGIGLGWIFSKESWFSRKLSFISFGKVRVSYGTTGNDQIGSYTYLSLYAPPVVGTPYQGTPGLEPRGLSNPYLQWEETKKFQSGIDLALFNDKLLLTANYIYNNSSNQLLSSPLPISTGFPSVTKNFPATVVNTSWEISLSSTEMKFGSLVWNTSVNISIPKNKLKKFPDLANSAFSDVLVVGQSINVFKTHKALGVNSQTGVYEVADADGNPVESPDPRKDRVVLFSYDPKFYGGWDNKFTFKGIEISFLFQFVKQLGNAGFKISNNDIPGRRFLNQPTTVLQRWRKSGDISNIQLYNSDFRYLNNWVNYVTSDAGSADASFIRLRNVSLSYDFQTKVISKLRISNLRIFAQGQNLATITNFIGPDPENQGPLPPLRVVTVGLKLSI